RTAANSVHGDSPNRFVAGTQQAFHRTLYPAGLQPAWINHAGIGRWPKWGDCVEKLLLGDVQFSRRPTSAAFKKSAGGPANLSIEQRARSSTGLRWCLSGRCSIELQFGEFSSRSLFRL